MRVVYFGTPEFAAEILEVLVKAKVELVALVTKPDTPQGRSLKITPPAAALRAKSLGLQIPILQPEKCSTPEMIETLKAFQADLFVVVAYGEIVSQALLDVPRFGAINVHASLLPLYRGAAPIQRVLFNGEKETGISIIRLVRKMDAGDVLYEEKLTILPEMDAGSLENALCTLGAKCLLKVIADFTQGSVTAVPQDHAKATFAEKITAADCQLDFTKPAIVLQNQIRALSPAPGAWCQVLVRNEKKRLKVYQAELVATQERNSLTVPCQEGFLKLKTIQLEGKPKMSADEFLKGIPASQISFC